MKDIVITKNYIAESLIDTQKIAIAFAKNVIAGNIVVLQGDLGAGKTEFIRTVCTCLGVNEIINSPSFAIVNQYEVELLNIFHIDLYRINSSTELMNIGFCELFDIPNSVYFIEWPENSFNMIPHTDYTISIIQNDNNTRNISINTWTS